jgi:uncharacterized protein (AIM24 family)
MAEFHIVQREGQRYVKIDIRNETVRAEAGAMSVIRGDIVVDSPVPSPLHMIKCGLSDEPIIRPRYRGTGEICLNPTPGGYHSFEVGNETWVLDNGIYWASEDTVKLGLYREGALTSYWAGEGFIDFQTKVSGTGRVILNASGPVEEIELKGDSIAVEGRQVIARTAGLTYRIRRPTRSLFSFWLSGENFVRHYSGHGKVLLITTPYLNMRMAAVLAAT